MGTISQLRLAFIRRSSHTSSIITSLPLSYDTNLKLNQFSLVNSSYHRCQHSILQNNFHHNYHTKSNNVELNAFNKYQWNGLDVDLIRNCQSNGRRFSTSSILCRKDSNSKVTSDDESKKSNVTDPFDDGDIDTKKLGLVAKFKLMYKKYWYVLVPVHLITSTGWMVGFYYLSESGVDIPALLEMLNISESITEKLKNSSMGHLAIAYVCYKIATPLRYMVTIGGTTLSIKYLSQWGYIRPVPSKEQFRKMYDNRRAQIKKGYEDLQEKGQEMTRKTTKNLKKG